jgi:hypothetical protein
MIVCMSRYVSQAQPLSITAIFFLGFKQWTAWSLQSFTGKSTLVHFLEHQIVSISVNRREGAGDMARAQIEDLRNK